MLTRQTVELIVVVWIVIHVGTTLNLIITVN